MNVSFDRLRETVDSMPGNFVLYRFSDDGFRCVHYTKRVLSLLGMEESDVPEDFEPCASLFPEDRVVIFEKLRDFVRAGHSDTIDFTGRLTHKTKGFIWIHAMVDKIKTSDAGPLVALNILNVTDEMTNSHVIMDASDWYVCVIEKNTKRLLYANTAFYRFVDAPANAPMGQCCYDVLCHSEEMRKSNDCMCFAAINADPPVEIYNPDTDMYMTMTGREITWGDHEAYVFYLADVSKEKMMDEKLRDAQRRFDVALENSDLMIWEYDMVNNLCINSVKAGSEYAIPLIMENYPESLYETPFVPPETVEQLKDVKRRLFAGETDFSVERRTINDKGESQWMKVSYSLECDEAGKPLRAIVCGIDINARKELELKYADQVEYRDNLAKQALFSAHLDLDGDTIVDFISDNEMLEQVVASAPSAEDFLKKFFATAVFDEKSEVSPEIFRPESLNELFELGRSQLQTVYHSAMLNMYLDLNFLLYRNPSNMHLEAFFVVDDVTRSTIMQSVFESLVAKDYDYVGLIDTLDGTVYFLTDAPDIYSVEIRDDRSVIAYEDMIKIFFSHYGDELATEDDLAVESESLSLDFVKKTLESTSEYEFNYRLRHSDGDREAFRMGFSYVDDAKSRIMISRSNITATVLEEQRNQQMLEDALESARESAAAKSDFLSRMSHDMRTPMNGIIGMTQLTQDIEDLPQEARDNLQSISDSSDYLLDLINDTLDMSKIDNERLTLNYEVFDVGQLIHHILATVTPLADEKNITLEFVPINAQLEYIRSDPMRIHQLFLNVLSNSIKFTQPGGTIRMEVECLKRENGIAYDRISVEDNGCGMSPEFLEHVFEPFAQENSDYSRRQQGTGLGMSIVKKLIELMGGTISIESELGKGTKVTTYVNFERVYEVPDTDAEPVVRDATSLDGKTILLAEDNETNAVIATRLLEKRGMKIERAEDGVEAVDRFNQSAPGHFDCILMDVHMPNMGGLEAARTIRAGSHPDAGTIPIIALTANAYVEDVNNALEAGMNAHVAKPFDIYDLYGEIEQQIAKREH